MLLKVVRGVCKIGKIYIFYNYDYYFKLVMFMCMFGCYLEIVYVVLVVVYIFSYNK